MKTKVIKKPSPFYIPVLSKRASPKKKLLGLAQANGVLASRIVAGAKQNDFKIWRAMLEAVHLDHAVSTDAAAEADQELAARTRLIQTKLAQRNKDIEARRLAALGVDVPRDADDASAIATQEERRQPPAKRSQQSAAPPRKRQTLYGHNLSRIIRWMGVRDWTHDEVKLVFESLGLQVSENTIRIQLKAGKTTRKGWAELSRDEKRELRKIRRDAIANAN